MHAMRAESGCFKTKYWAHKLWMEAGQEWDRDTSGFLLSSLCAGSQAKIGHSAGKLIPAQASSAPGHQYLVQILRYEHREFSRNSERLPVASHSHASISYSSVMHMVHFYTCAVVLES